MSTAPVAVLALANQLRNLGTEAHNRSREDSGLEPRKWENWDQLTIDHRKGWLAVAEHVLANYVFKHSDPDALVHAAGAEIFKSAGMLIDRENCDDLARLVLISAGVIAEEKAVAS